MIVFACLVAGLASLCMTGSDSISVSPHLFGDTPISKISGNKHVNTTHGHVQGVKEHVLTRDGEIVNVDVYWGIPYAKPPVGDLRFARPEPSDPWDGVYLAAFPPKACMQVLSVFPDLIPNPTTPLSEDCLYLNLWVPRGTDPDTQLPVMVWSDSELFDSGGSTVPTFNGAELAASQRVIVISLNYRLGPFGLLFMDDQTAPGNVGLLDIVLALEWVKNNVASFGGDPESITLFGQSTGGTAISLMLLSPLAQNLFNRIILQSGIPTVKFIFQNNDTAYNSGKELAKAVGCDSDDNAAIVTCLKQVSAAELSVKYHIQIKNLALTMMPVADGYFLTQNPRTAFRNEDMKPVDIIIGNVKDEGTYICSLLWPEEYSFRSLIPPAPLTAESLDAKVEQFINIVIRPEFVAEVLASVREVYELDTIGSADSDARFKALKIITDDYSFRCPHRYIATKYANSSQNAYLYLFSHRPDFSTLPEWAGVYHTAMLPFVFGHGTAATPDLSPRELTLSQLIMTYWGNFAKFGNPSPGGSGLPEWPALTVPDPSNYLVFNDALGTEIAQTETERCALWNGLPDSHLAF